MNNIKPKLGLFGLSGCNGCQQTFFHTPALIKKIIEKFDISYAPSYKDDNSNDRLDLCLVEGMVSCEEDKKRLEELREKSKILIALGSCACFGNMPLIPLLNETDVDKIKNQQKNMFPTRPKAIVKIDFIIPGCPPEQHEIIEVLDNFLLGKLLVRFNYPVCYNCILKENKCLLFEGKECIGPVIEGNCKAICPSFNVSCTGCRGQSFDYNLKSMINILKEMGLSEKLIEEKLTKYSPLEFKEAIQKEGKK